MTIVRIDKLARAAVLAGVAMLAMAACTEPVASRPVVTAEKALEAQLVWSDSAPAPGKTVDVFAQVTTPTPESIGSYTARIRYDSTALRFAEEIAVSDDALRATNASSGLLRFAGAAPKGLRAGRLAGFRFLVLRQNAMRGLQLVIDEMHTVARIDAASQLRAMPNRVGAAP